MNHDEVTMGGKRSQRKGAEGEVELCKIFREHGLDCSRGGSLSFGEVPDITGLPGIHVEVKRQEKQSVYEWINQASRDSEKFRDGLPAVFWRKNRRPWLVIMPLDSWISMYKWPEMDENGPRRGVKY